LAVWRSGTWFVIPSSRRAQPIIQGWGEEGDIPVPGDYDHDGKIDFAVWRLGTWFITPTTQPAQPIIQGWGTLGDVPM
jgi:hypothetical protein